MIRKLLDQVRMNHALEHATIALLLKAEAIAPPLAGYSTPRGFFILGRVETADVEAAAAEALRRLKAGESGLAISYFCGTNILVGGALTAIASAIVLGRRNRLQNLSSAISASTIALMAAPTLGRWLQKNVTTLAAVEHMEVTRVSAPLGASCHWVGAAFRG